MASTAQKSSRWGSFLAGVESKLDTILADEDTAAKAAQNRDDSKVEGQPPKKEPMMVPSRTTSHNRAQDRLNEKLARAMANKNLGRKGDASGPPSGVPSRTASPANGLPSPRASTESQREKHVDEDSKERPAEPIPTTNGMNQDLQKEADAGKGSEALADVKVEEPMEQPLITSTSDLKNESEPPRQSTDSQGSVSTRPSLEITQSTTPSVDSPRRTAFPAPMSPKLPEEYEKTIEQLRSDNEAAELRRQEETHEYLERIDALQAKLQYLTKEAAEVAKNALSQAPPGSAEQKLAAKDEKIALLIEEGQSLSQTELKHMTIIKKLRAKSKEDGDAAVESKRMAEKHDRIARKAQDRAKRADTAEKRALEKVKAMTRLEKDLEGLKAEREAKDSLIRDLQSQLSEATSSAKQAEEKARAEALEAERKHAADLADELSSVKTEKELAEKDHQNQLRGLREKAEREKERARVAEIERQGEQNMLESRLETYRARAEEVSAGQGGDVQAKLLRQIETLQNQYAIASENWQGIEGSLLARVAALEKERDDMAKREADVRRKARESVSLSYNPSPRTPAEAPQNTKARRIEDELANANAKTADATHELSSLTTQLIHLQSLLKKSEADLQTTTATLKTSREEWEKTQARLLEEERSRIHNELRSSPQDIYQQFSASPITQTRTRKSSNAADRSPHSRRLGLAITSTSTDRTLSRRSSTQPILTTTTSGIMDFQPQRMERTDSLGTIPSLSVNNGIPEAPAIDDIKENDFFSGVHTPATPPERTINDLISVSTAGAGPSVQLVERMSAAVRRLESEKAAHRDELSRLGAQLHEAREQVVELMRDNEHKRAADERVKGLEKELREVRERFEATLEMLGEKSERVEELKADVGDLKGLYRELVESTMR